MGAEILKNISNFLAANPDKAVQTIRKDVVKAINVVRKGKDLKKLNTLKQQLSKLNAIGGFKSIVPAEGLVFKYKGKILDYENIDNFADLAAFQIITQSITFDNFHNARLIIDPWSGQKHFVVHDGDYNEKFRISGYPFDFALYDKNQFSFYY